jgi:hypothetical protein
MAPAELIRRATGRARRMPLGDFLAAYLGLWLVTGLAAGAAHSIGAARDLVASIYHPKLYAHSPADFGTIARRFADNATRGWPLALALAPYGRWAWAVGLADCLLAANLAVNAALVGGAVGLAGIGIAPYLLHLPMEWAALAVTVSGWLAARRGASRAVVVAHLGAFVALLLVAAAIETYAVPHL